MRDATDALYLMLSIGYALWLVPETHQFEALLCLMRFRPSGYSYTRYSQRSFPDLPPHITLLTFPSAPAALLSLNTLLPCNVNPVPVAFESLAVGNSYLGSLFVTVARTPELVSLQRTISDHVENNVGIEVNRRRFSPHVSLFYLDETGRGDRHLLCRELQNTGRIRLGARHLTLNCTFDGAPSSYRNMAGFNGAQIWLVDCRGPVNSWRVLDKCLLPRYATPAAEPCVRRQRSRGRFSEPATPRRSGSFPRAYYSDPGPVPLYPSTPYLPTPYLPAPYLPTPYISYPYPSNPYPSGTPALTYTHYWSTRRGNYYCEYLAHYSPGPLLSAQSNRTIGRVASEGAFALAYRIDFASRVEVSNHAPFDYTASPRVSRIVK